MTLDPHHEHVDLEVAADFDERLLDAASSADVAARIAGCPTCAAALDAIHRTRSGLAALPVVPMPSTVADRLQEALAKETLSARVPGGAATVTAVRRPSRRRLWLPAAAGIAAAAAVILVVVRPHDPQPAGTAQQRLPASAGAGGSATGVPAVASGVDYGTTTRARLVQGVDAAPLAYSASVTDQPAAGSAPAATSAAASAAAPVPAPSPLSAVPGPSGSAEGLSDTANTPARTAALPDMTVYTPLRDPATLDACVARLIDPETGTRPSLIDYASFNGTPAVAIFFPSSVAKESDVYVVGLRCGPATDDLLDFLLHVPTPTP
ncbi:MAG: hypothetical protein QOF57_2754 [Frankiaceae bacterium]|nr:hypothetical protein [Frankiaceae bacterium]